MEVYTSSTLESLAMQTTRCWYQGEFVGQTTFQNPLWVDFGAKCHCFKCWYETHHIQGVMTNPRCKEMLRCWSWILWMCSSPRDCPQLNVTIMPFFFLFYLPCPHKCSLLEIHSDWWIDFQLATLGLSSLFRKALGPKSLWAPSRSLRASVPCVNVQQPLNR